MCRGRNRTADVTGLQVIVDRPAQIRPALLPVPAKGRRGLRAPQPEENRGRLGVERHGIARPPRALEMRESVLERMRGELLLARHSRIFHERRRSHQELRARGVRGELGSVVARPKVPGAARACGGWPHAIGLGNPERCCRRVRP